jgi:hypothetical protein
MARHNALHLRSGAIFDDWGAPWAEENPSPTAANLSSGAPHILNGRESNARFVVALLKIAHFQEKKSVLEFLGVTPFRTPRSVTPCPR